MAEMQVDETFCGPLCQHPSCWDAQKRCLRGYPRQTTKCQESEEESDEEGLPTQKVVNLLGDFGDDPRDKFPLKHGGRPVHEHTNTSIQLGRTGPRDSFPRVRAPNATPSSLLHGSTGNIVGSRSAPPKLTPPSLKTVEVQEVFDLDDLQSAWNATFKTKSYYVWVPNENRRPKLEPIQKVQIKRRQEGPDTVSVKDKTEEMVPREVEWEREATKMLMEAWPVIRKKNRAQASPRMEHSQPYPKTPRGVQKQKNYYGIDELLDLPKDVLMGVLDCIQERDLLDQKKFADALVKAIPKLEKRSKSLALANSQVLKQRKIKLLDGSTKSHQLHDMPQQVFMLDNDTLDKVSIANDPAGHPDIDDYSLEPFSTVRSNQLNKKQPLPSIAKESPRARVPFISLGLPEIPSGVKTTRPFNYKKKDLDFTLGRVPAPPQTRPSESPPSTDRGSTLHVTMPSMPSEDMASGVKEWKQEDDGPNTPLHAVSPAHSTQVPYPPAVTPATRQGDRPSDGTPVSPLKAVSQEPSGSPLGPRAPVMTPGTPGQMGALQSPEQTALGTIQEAEVEIKDKKPAAGVPPVSRRSVRFAEVPPTPPQPPSSPTRIPPSGTPDAEHRQDHISTVQEQDEEGQGSVGNLAEADQARQPICGIGLTEEEWLRGIEESESKPEEPMENPMEGLMVISKMKGTPRQPSSLSAGKTKSVPSGVQHLAANTEHAQPSPGLTPEPVWPQVDETKYMRTPTPPNQENKEKAMANPMQSASGNPNVKLEPSETTSAARSPTKPTGGSREPAIATPVVAHVSPQEKPCPEPEPVVREASMQSDKSKKMIQERVMESPGPPPPSPEPKNKEKPSNPELHDRNTGLGAYADICEEISDIGTITARPPSDIDDHSPLPTPRHPISNTPRPVNPANTPNPEPSLSVEDTPRPMNADPPLPPADISSLDETPRHDPLNLLNTQSQAESNHTQSSNDNSVSASVLPKQVLHSTPIAEEAEGSMSDQERTWSVDKTDAQPVNPLCTDSEHQQTSSAQLDQFDATTEEFEQQLKEEYDKLSTDDKS